MNAPTHIYLNVSRNTRSLEGFLIPCYLEKFIAFFQHSLPSHLYTSVMESRNNNTVCIAHIVAWRLSYLIKLFILHVPFTGKCKMDVPNCFLEPVVCKCFTLPLTGKCSAMVRQLSRFSLERFVEPIQ